MSLLLIAGASLLFVNTADLTVISSFAGATFLLSEVVAAEFLYSERRLVAKHTHRFLCGRWKFTYQLSSRSPNAMIPGVEE